MCSNTKALRTRVRCPGDRTALGHLVYMSPGAGVGLGFPPPAKPPPCVTTGNQFPGQALWKARLWSVLLHFPFHQCGTKCQDVLRAQGTSGFGSRYVVTTERQAELMCLWLKMHAASHHQNGLYFLPSQGSTHGAWLTSCFSTHCPTGTI